MNKYRAQSNAAQRARIRLRSCTLKRRYPTAEAARTTGNDIYHCDFCDGFHTTSAHHSLAAHLRRNRRSASPRLRVSAS